MIEKKKLLWTPYHNVYEIKKTRTRAILPRGGRFPNQTVVAQSHQEQAVCIVAGTHMGGGQQAFPQVQRDI